jgi:diguanylate cyclase (GGDEF)-like protein
VAERSIDASAEASGATRLRGDIARLEREIAQRDRVIAEQAKALAHGAKIFARSSEAARIGVWECELPDNRLTWTDGVYDIFELPRGSAVTRDCAVRFYAPDSLAELERLRTEAIRTCGGFTFDARITTARGNARWMRITATVETENGAPARIFGMKQDITEEKILQERTRFLAECDVLTGLANRSRFQAALSARRDGAAGLRALLLIDLDGFKDVNDTFGHAAGDACLAEIADRLRAACGAAAPVSSLVARIGGDEFAILLDGVGIAEAEDLGRRIVAAAGEPIRRGRQSYQIGASVGIAVTGAPDRLDTVDLQGDADLALYAAKAAGKNGVARFHPGMRADGSARVRIIDEVAAAHEEGRLALVYQPVVDLADGRVCGHEALLRWRRADGVLAEAAGFAAALRDPDLARRLDEWVLDAALEQAGRWRRAGAPVGRLAVNLGAARLCSPGFADRLLAALAREGLAPGDLGLDIAEGAFAEAPDAMVAPLARLRDAGIRIALDDFGAGRTALMELKRLPVDAIKIDGAIVRRVHEPSERIALEALVHLARGYGLDLVAEGVETAEQRARVARIGVRYAQGWHFAAPMPAERVMAQREAMAAERLAPAAATSEARCA